MEFLLPLSLWLLKLAITYIRNWPLPSGAFQGQWNQQLKWTIASELSPQHPICYDITDLCKCVKEDKLQKFTVTMLKKILLHFDLAFNSKDRKKDLMQKLFLFVQECNYFLSDN